jgi:hypothetical protein
MANEANNVAARRLGVGEPDPSGKWLRAHADVNLDLGLAR